MKHSPAVVMLVVLLGAGPFAQGADPSGSETATTEVAPHRVSGPPVEYFGENLFTIDAATETGSTILLGVEYLSGEFWVTAAGLTTNTEPNYLFRLDSSGAVLDRYDQPTDSTWGWRDLVFDGSFLYASDSNLLEEIDPTTGLTTGTTIPCPEDPCRGLAFVPATGNFWTANFDGPLYEFDRSGEIVSSHANALSVYGLAFDGSWLWACSQDGPGVQISQIDPATGSPTGVAFNGDSTGGGTPLAGGCSYSETVLPDEKVLVVMHQAEVDTIVGYDVDFTVAPPSCADLPVTVFVEDFSDGMPGAFAVTSTGGDPSCVWGDDSLEGAPEGNRTGGSGGFADADSDDCGSGSAMFTDMTSPTMDLSGFGEVGIQFSSDFFHLGTSEAVVEVATNGAGWTPVWVEDVDARGPSTVFLDVSSILAGAPDAAIRFRYRSPEWNFWWQVDDITVCAARRSGPPGIPAGECAGSTLLALLIAIGGVIALRRLT